MEDFTTYTISGAQSFLTLTTTTNRATLATIMMAHKAWLVKDFGANHFTNWEHSFTAYNGGMNPATAFCIYMVSNTNMQWGYQYVNDNDGIAIIFNNTAGGVRNFFLENLGDNTEIASTNNFTLGTIYYFVVCRAGDKVTVDIYNDSSHTSLFETLYLTCKTSRYQYMIPISSYGQGAGVVVCEGYVENLELNEYPNTWLLTATSATLEFPMPVDLNFNDGREQKSFHYWNNSDSVFDIGKDTENITLSGYYLSGVSVFMEMLDEIVDNGEEITISGFNNNMIDTTWVITSYNYTVNAGVPDIAQWTLNLEKT